MLLSISFYNNICAVHYSKRAGRRRPRPEPRSRHGETRGARRGSHFVLQRSFCVFRKRKDRVSRSGPADRYLHQLNRLITKLKSGNN